MNPRHTKQDKRYRILTILFLGVLLLSAVQFAIAGDTTVPQLNYTPLAPLPETGTCTGLHCLPDKVQTLGGYLRGVYILGVILAGLLAVFSIVRGGFELLFTDSILGHSEGKGIILRALGGLLIVYSSYILMNTINPQLGRDLNLELALPRITVERGLMDQLISWTPDLPDFDEANRREILDKSKEARETIHEKEEGAKALRDEAAAMGPFNKMTPEQKTKYGELIRDAQKLEAEALKTFADAAARNSVLNQMNVNNPKYDPVFEQQNIDRMQINLSGAASELAARDELGLATQVLREQVQQGNSMRVGITQYEMHKTANLSITPVTVFNSNRAITQMSAMVSDTDKAITRLEGMRDRAGATDTVRVETAPGNYTQRNAKEYINEQIGFMRSETKTKIGQAKTNCTIPGQPLACATWQPPAAYR